MKLNNSLLERYSLFTTSVEPCICGFTHQVFGTVARELTNLINFFLVIRIFFLFSFSLFLLLLLSFTVNFLGSCSFMRRTKSLGEFVPEIERYLHKRKGEARNNIAMVERTLKSMQHLLRKSHMLLLCTQRLRVTTLRLSLHYLTWCSKIIFLDHPLRIQICISQRF